MPWKGCLCQRFLDASKPLGRCSQSWSLSMFGLQPSQVDECQWQEECQERQEAKFQTQAASSEASENRIKQKKFERPFQTDFRLHFDDVTIKQKQFNDQQIEVSCCWPFVIWGCLCGHSQAMFLSQCSLDKHPEFDLNLSWLWIKSWPMLGFWTKSLWGSGRSMFFSVLLIYSVWKKFRNAWSKQGHATVCSVALSVFDMLGTSSLLPALKCGPSILAWNSNFQSGPLLACFVIQVSGLWFKCIS